MARASYIYIAYNHADEIIGAWTVKHELVTHARYALSLSRDYRVFRVLRTRDGSAAGDDSHQVEDISEQIYGEIWERSR